MPRTAILYSLFHCTNNCCCYQKRYQWSGFLDSQRQKRMILINSDLDCTVTKITNRSTVSLDKLVFKFLTVLRYWFCRIAVTIVPLYAFCIRTHDSFVFVCFCNFQCLHHILKHILLFYTHLWNAFANNRWTAVSEEFGGYFMFLSSFLLYLCRKRSSRL